MAVTLVPFEEKHLDACAALLAAQQRRSRSFEPLLPRGPEDVEQARQILETLFRADGAEGLLAVRDGEPLAMLMATARLPERWMGLPPHGRALANGERPDVYLEMYAALADRWVRRGFFYHSVPVLVSATDDREVWDTLGFGRWLVCGVRDVSAPVAEAPELDIRALDASDLDIITGLESANARHHNTSPIFVPYLLEDRARYRTQTEGLLETAANAHFVAFEDGQPAGMNSFISEPRHSPVLQPENDIYLFQGVVEEHYRHAGIGRALLAHSMRWAREQGFKTCTLHYFSANLIGSRFWLGQGYRPYYIILSRHIDERMAYGRPEIQTR